MQFFALNSASQYGAMYRSEGGEYRVWLRDAGMTGYICTVMNGQGQELAAFRGPEALQEATDWCRNRGQK